MAPTNLGHCDWTFADGTECQQPATTLFVIPDSDSMDNGLAFCDQHTTAWESPENQPYNTDWIRA